MSANLAERGLRSVAELAAAKPHGTRLRYLGGCKCLKCRMANSNYETARARARAAGDWNGNVSAAEARKHILKLSRKGIGRRSIAEASDVAETVIAEIRSGKKQQIRARTARRILAVTPAAIADHALVPAARAWRLINELLEEGFTKAHIARELGYARPALQLNRTTITAANELAIVLISLLLLVVVVIVFAVSLFDFPGDDR
jgi:hypothetical protein